MELRKTMKIIITFIMMILRSLGRLDLSVRYIADRYLPDKAIDLIDQAGAIAATNHVVDVDIKQVALVLQEMKGIPITNVLRNDTSRLRNIKR